MMGLPLLTSTRILGRRGTATVADQGEDGRAGDDVEIPLDSSFERLKIPVIYLNQKKCQHMSKGFFVAMSDVRCVFFFFSSVVPQYTSQYHLLGETASRSFLSSNLAPLREHFDGVKPKKPSPWLRKMRRKHPQEVYS